MAEQDDNVWISREEYERLRANQAAPAPIAPTPTPPSTPILAVPKPGPNAQDEEKKVRQLQTWLGVILAIMLLLSMASSSLSRYSLIPVGLFCVFAIMSLVDYLRKRHSDGLMFGLPITHADTTDPAIDAKQRHSRYKWLLLIAIIVIVLPILVPLAFIILILLFAAFNGGNVGT